MGSRREFNGDSIDIFRPGPFRLPQAANANAHDRATRPPKGHYRYEPRNPSTSPWHALRPGLLPASPRPSQPPRREGDQQTRPASRSRSPRGRSFDPSPGDGEADRPFATGFEAYAGRTEERETLDEFLGSWRRHRAGNQACGVPGRLIGGDRETKEPSPSLDLFREETLRNSKNLPEA